MSGPSDPRMLVLHGLRLKGFAAADAVAESVGLTDAEVKPELDGLVGADLATYRDGRISGYALTPLGRTTQPSCSATSWPRPARPTLSERRLPSASCPINKDLLAICTAWQLRDVAGESVINDHTDAAHDARVIAQLADLDAKVQPICADLGAALERFGGYGARLGEALDKVRAGDVDWFTKPMIASYHTVWFELHEDLLATLGIDRAAEASS